LRNWKDIHVTKDANRRDNIKIKNKFVEIPQKEEQTMEKQETYKQIQDARETKKWKERQFQGRNRDAKNMKTKEREKQKKTGERIALIQLWRQSREGRGTTMYERGAQER